MPFPPAIIAAWTEWTDARDNLAAAVTAEKDGTLKAAFTLAATPTDQTPKSVQAANLADAILQTHKDRLVGEMVATLAELARVKKSQLKDALQAEGIIRGDR